jgi:cytochrome P450
MMGIQVFRPLAAMVAASLLGGPVLAQDQSGEEMLAEAQAYLHLTCKTLHETYKDDEEAYLNVIDKMIAVSLNNRQIDFTELDLTAEETAEIQAEFADQLGDACAVDADALMAGIVDRSVADLVLYYD